MIPARAALVAAVAFVLADDASPQQTTRVSVSSSGAQVSWGGWFPAISADGGTVGFDSAADGLVPGDTNGVVDVFVHDRSSGITERISVDSSGIEADGPSYSPSISADGRFVAFTSGASNLVTGDVNSCDDIFVHDRSTGTTERVNVDSSGVEGDARSFLAAISSDGMFVAFDSLSDNLVAGDAGGFRDVFVHERATGITERVSLDSSGAEANGSSMYPGISADGRFIAFPSFASNLVSFDGNQHWDVFVHDRSTGTTECVSVDASGAVGITDSGNGGQPPSLSADGRMVAFDSRAWTLVPNNNASEDAYVRDRLRGVTDRISESSSGVAGNGVSGGPSISADGSSVAFWSNATNLVAGDANLTTDAFVRARRLAGWSNYGTGLSGTRGVPTFTSRSDPLLGTTVTLDLANSYAFPTFGLLFLGYQRASLHSGSGGDLQVLPALVIAISFSYGANSYTDDIPDDSKLCGLGIDLQAIESDPGAAKGVSFTQGLELVLGR